jgi:non-specific protein-tyrosine kinase
MEQDTTSPEEFTTIDLQRYAYLLWSWAWLIVLAAVLAGGAAFFYSRSQTPIYQASTTLMVDQAAATKSTDYNSILTSERLTSTYAEMITTQPILEEVVNRLALPMSAADLKKAITVTAMEDTQLIKITIESADPALGAQIGNTLVELFAAEVQEMQTERYAASLTSLQAQVNDYESQIKTLNSQISATIAPDEKTRLEDKLTQFREIYSNLLMSYEQARLAEAQTTSNVIQVEPAGVPTTPIRPKVMQNCLLATIVGMMLAVGGVFAAEALNDTVKDPETLIKRLNLPILGVIAHHEQEEGSPITQRQPRSPVSEAFRSLRTNIHYASVDHPMRRIMVTSPTPTDGKTTVTANLAVVLAQSGKRVIVLDADMRRPKIHRMLGTRNQRGLSSLFMQQSVYLNRTVQKTPVVNVGVISSGELPPNPAELLGSQKMVEILGIVQEKADVILIDTPPVLSVTDAVILSECVDGVLIVIKPGSTKEAAFRQTVTQLRQAGAHILGVVINEVGSGRSYYNYHYKSYYKNYYHYSYGEDGTRKKVKTSKHARQEPVFPSTPDENVTTPVNPPAGNTPSKEENPS